jgi:putative membrane protein
MIRRSLFFAFALFVATSALAATELRAHGGSHGEGVQKPKNWAELLWAWEFDFFVVLPLAISAVWYAIGLMRMWRAAGFGKGVRTWEAASFAGGWLALVLALVSPLHTWGNVLFSAHMTQHEILMLVAAPLLVLSKPIVAFLKALPASWAKGISRAALSRPWQVFWTFVTGVFVAWLIHAVILWIWHVPALFDATIENEALHAFQHLSFVLSALLFWWALMHSQPRAISLGVAVLYLFTTALHSGLLGALITFAATAIYPSYARTTQAWGLTPLEDQQLGGLIMWIPACSIYIVAGLALFAAWMRQTEEQTRRREEREDAALAASAVAREGAG